MRGKTVDYAFDLALPSGSFVAMELGALALEIDAEIATAGPISIYMHAFEDGTGGHKVHRNSGGTDGLIVIDPTGSRRALAFRFADQVF